MRCGLLGEKLGHSYSPAIHGQLGDYSYEFFEKKPEELADFLTKGDFAGLNVTIPYKKAVLPYCAELTPQAEALGAVNTIIRRSDGSLLGHNTDYSGFKTMLQHSGLKVAGKRALVLGSGGASNTAVAVLKAAGAQVIVISRQGEDNYENLHLHADAAVIVNATPVGMYPDTDAIPVDIGQFSKLEGVLDLIYNPARTRLIQAAAKQGLVAENGLLMLVAQAKEASEWFTGAAIADDKVTTIYKQMKQQMENIVLIGMPGSGKSTVGKLLAEQTGKAFADADELIPELAGKSIQQIFAEDGEEVFRQWETKALTALGKKTGMVIATGGGCVMRAENEAILRQNGRIFCLERQLESLDTQGRPLSQTSGVAQLYRIRKPLYAQFADYTIDNNGAPEDTVAEILQHWEEIL
ncbi:MAG: shikimate kinase [Oscillospiraceae bacterium]|nr:shikimate kinase [Oscillospiraceae bacterium]